MITNRVLNTFAALSVLTAAFTAYAQTPKLSPLQFVTTDAAIGPAAGDQRSPVISRGGNVFLSVWQDRRGGDSGQDIFAARLDASGRPIDATPFVISQGAADQTTPKVVWNGENWLVVWASQEPTQFFWSWQLEAVRVSREGLVLDPTPLTLTSLDTSAVLYSVSSDGANWLVAYEGTSAGDAATKGVRISPDGTILDSPAVTLLTETFFVRADLELAFSGNQYLLLWGQFGVSSNDIVGVRITPSLQVIDNAPRPIAATALSESHPRAGSNGTDFYVVWEASVSQLVENILGTRVTASGVVPDPGGVLVGNSAAFPPLPAVTWDGTQWMVAWADVDVVKAARVSASGRTIDAGGVVVDSTPALGRNHVEVAALAPGGARLVWQDSRYKSLDVFRADFAANGSAGATSLVSSSAHAHEAPRFATDGTRYMATFLSFISGQSRVMVQALSAAGAPTGAPSLLATGNLASPEVAFDGTVYLVVWTDSSTSTVFGRRVNASGAPIDPAPFAIMPGAESDVAATGSTFLVTCSNAPTNPELRYPFAVRVDGSGAVLGSPVQIGANFTVGPRVSKLGSGWIVVWSQHPTHDDPTSVVKAAIVNADGSNLPQVLVESSAARSHDSPAVAGNQSEALAVWQDDRSGVVQIYGKRISVNGSVLDASAFSMTPTPVAERSAAVAWDGLEFVVAWEDLRADTFFLDQRTDIFAARVSPAGVVLDPANLLIVASPAPEQLPAVAGANGIALIGASLFRQQEPFSAFRTGFRFLNTNGRLPVAVATANPVSGNAPLTVSFRSRGSFDPDGSITSYKWNFGDGASADLADPSHTYLEPGTYLAILTVTDNSALSSSASQVITVLVPSSPAPFVQATAAPQSGSAPLTVSFGERIVSGNATSYLWNFGDGSTSILARPTHTYSSAGYYDAVLTITDSSGARGTSVVVISVLGTLRSTAIDLTVTGTGSGLIGDATVRVQDSSGALIANAEVDVTWTIPGPFTIQQSVPTGANGMAAFSTNTSALHGTFTTTINNIIKAGNTFDRAHSVLTKSVTK